MRKGYIMLKFANVAKVNQYIKAYDFKPMADREDRYMIGEVFDTNVSRQGVSYYAVRCVYASHDQYEVNEVVFVPHEVFLFEYEERVSLFEVDEYTTDADIRYFERTK